MHVTIVSPKIDRGLNKVLEESLCDNDNLIKPNYMTVDKTHMTSNMEVRDIVKNYSSKMLHQSCVSKVFVANGSCVKFITDMQGSN